MLELGVTEYRLAKESGISRATINTIFNGKNKNPGYDTMLKLGLTLLNTESRNSSSSKTTAGDICAKKLIKMRPDWKLFVANTMFDLHDEITQMPVFDGDNLVGQLTEKSLRKKMTEKGWQNKKVKHAMEPAPPKVPYETPLERVSELLEQHTSVLVWNQSGTRITGIITDNDIRKYYKMT